MLQEITGEDRVQGPIRKRPGMRAILLEDGDALRSAMVDVGIEVHGILLAGDHMVDELAIPGAEIEDRSVTGKPMAKVRDQDPPDLRPIVGFAGKTGAVDLLQLRLIW